jgi:SAM-dependent methyltransferase
MQTNHGSEQTAGVGSYFDEISETYRDRYGAKNPFHEHFFRERLRAATDRLDFENKTVLDVGAGTGPLYDQIAQATGLNYYACDISANMLAQSAIPHGRAFVGKASETNFPVELFDYIFLLGVTTYQTPDELNETFRFMARRLAEGGAAVLSFTNRASIDHAVRSALKLAKPLLKRGVFGQDFATYTYRLSQIEQLARQHGFIILRTIYHNQAVTPFNTLFPRASVSASKMIARFCPSSLLPACSADFLVFIEREVKSREG